MFDFLSKPKGPSFSKAVPVTLEFSGTKVYFKVPDYTYKMVDRSDRDRLPTVYNLYASEQYHSTLDGYGHPPRLEDGDIGGIGCFKTVWGFEKALLGGERDSGTLSFVIGLNYISKYGSLFKPQNIETAIVEDLNLSYGPKSKQAGEGGGGRRFSCPLDWSVDHFDSLTWIAFRVDEDGGAGRASSSFWWSIPLTEEHYLTFEFNDTGYNSERLMECFRVLAKQIVSSCVIEYSEDAKRQMKKAEDEGLGEDYSKSREPLAWEEYELHPEKYKLKSS